MLDNVLSYINDSDTTILISLGGMVTSLFLKTSKYLRGKG